MAHAYSTFEHNHLELLTNISENIVRTIKF